MAQIVELPVQALPPWLTWSLSTVALPTPTPGVQGGNRQTQAILSVAVVDQEALGQVQPTQTYCGPSIPLGPGWVSCSSMAPAPTSSQASMDDYPFVPSQSSYSALDSWADYPASTQAPYNDDSPGETVLTASPLVLPTPTNSDAVVTPAYQATSTFTMPTALPTSSSAILTPNSNVQSTPSGVRATTIVAASLGGCLVVLLVSVLSFLLCRRRRKRTSSDDVPARRAYDEASSALSPTAAVLAAGNRCNVKRKAPPLSFNRDSTFHRDVGSIPEANLSVPSLLPQANTSGTLYVVNADEASLRESVLTYERRSSLPRDQLVMPGVGTGTGYGFGVDVKHRDAMTCGQALEKDAYHFSRESEESMWSLGPPPRPFASRAVVVSGNVNDEDRVAQEHHVEPYAQELTLHGWSISNESHRFRGTEAMAPRSADSIYTVYGGAPLSPSLPYGTDLSRSRASRSPGAAVWPIPRPPARPLRAAARVTPTVPTSWHVGMGAPASSSSGEEVVQGSPPTTARGGESEYTFTSTLATGQGTSGRAMSSLFSRRSFDSITRSFGLGGTAGARSTYRHSRQGDLEHQGVSIPPQAEQAGWSVLPEAADRRVRFSAMRMQPGKAYRDAAHVSFDGSMHHASPLPGVRAGENSPPSTAEQWSTVDADSRPVSPPPMTQIAPFTKLGVPRFAPLPSDVTPLSRLGQAQPRSSFAMSASDGAEIWSTQDSWVSREPAERLRGAQDQSRRNSAEQWSTIDVDSYGASSTSAPPLPTGPRRPLDLSRFGFLRNDTLRNDKPPPPPSAAQRLVVQQPRTSTDQSVSDGAEAWSTQDFWQSRTPAPPAPPSTPALNVRKVSSQHTRTDSSRSAASTGSTLSTDMVRAHLSLSEAEENALLPMHQS